MEPRLGAVVARGRTIQVSGPAFMRHSDGLKRPWRRTVGPFLLEPHAPISHATSSQTVTVIASAIGASSALVRMAMPVIALPLVPSVAMVALISSQIAETAAAILSEGHRPLA